LINIIIPVYNEEKILKEKAHYYEWLKTKGRLVFVDGGSFDRTVETALVYGQVLTSARGRARQMNKGVEETTEGHFLFLHVDTFISEKAIRDAVQILDNGTCGGCFTMEIDRKGLIFRIFENIVNLRARLFHVIDGDLGLFVKREAFNRVKRFDDIPIMEDIVFSRKLRKTGAVVVLPDQIIVSSRKWEKNGFLKTFGLYFLAYIQLWTKIPFFKNDPAHESR